jgi:Carboxypeptidase regulatory-like domain/TonB dependent receptor-like, beta-barrel
MKRIVQQAALLVLFTLTAGVCLAQTETARLQGTVSDQQGAAVPAASVTVTNTGTGRSLSVQTNAEGFYLAPALPAGHYHVVVEKSGFDKAAQDLALQITQVGVVDFKLQVGTQTQTVVVEAGSPVIDAADSAIGEVVEARQIEEMPLNGRNFTQLALLVPGVVRGSGNATGANGNAETFRYGQEGGASLVVNGIRAQGNNFILDGIDNNEALVNTIVLFPPADAIEEFKVQTNIAPAQFGRAGGALVVTSIKSGTNEYHGSVFWFNRNKQLNAENFFTSGPTPSFVRNQFGGSAGGPIIKNKLFFFGDYQGLRQNVPSGPSYATVPTDLMRKGDFSELLNPALTAGLTLPTGPPLVKDGPNQPAPIYDPTTNGTLCNPAIKGACPATNPNGALQFMGNGTQPNVIPTSRQNPAAQAYLGAYPEPNCGPGRAIQDRNCDPLYHNFKIERTITENWDDWDIRGDYIVDSKNSLFVRFSHGHVNQTNTTSLGVLPSGFGSGTNFNWPNGASIGLTTTFSPTFINEFRGGYVRDQYGYRPPLNNVDWCTQFGIVNCYTSGVQGGIALIGAYASQIEYTGDFGVYLIPQTGFNYNDTVTWIKGRHTVKLGADVLRRELNLYRPLAGKGYFQLAGNGNSPCCGPGQGHTDTGYEVADLFAGFVDAYSHGTPFGMVGTRSWENGLFAQDDVRLSPRLTLNLGLRYDILTWPVEVDNRQANFDLTTGALVVAGSNGTLRTSIPNDYHDFGPRIGFAYQLTSDGKTVLRGGYGLFYFVDRGGISNQLAQNPPFSGENSVTYGQGYRITLTGALPCEPNCTPAQLISTNATAPLPSGSFTNLNLSAPSNVSVVGLLPQNVTPQVSEWNLQVQRQLGLNQSISLAYVGTHGAHLVRNYNANQTLYVTGAELYPQLGSIQIQDTRGKSDYHAMQIQYEHRLTAGLQATAAFTWSKATDDSCGNLDACAPQLYTDYAIEHGLSTQDVDYVFSPSVIYELPFGRGKRWGGEVSRWEDYVIGGWQFNAIYALQGGTPFSITASGNPSSTRADLVGKPVIHPGSITNYVEPGAFAVPATNAAGIYLAPGTSGRDMIRGPGFSNMDFALFKNFPIAERVKGQFRVQAYNLTNTPHFANPHDTNLKDGIIGQINGVLTNSWRQVELAMRFTF